MEKHLSWLSPTHQCTYYCQEGWHAGTLLACPEISPEAIRDSLQQWLRHHGFPHMEIELRPALEIDATGMHQTYGHTRDGQVIRLSPDSYQDRALRVPYLVRVRATTPGMKGDDL